MEYIREQVESFTLGVSSKMINRETFYHLNMDQNESTQHQRGDGEPILIPLATYPSNLVVEWYGKYGDGGCMVGI